MFILGITGIFRTADLWTGLKASGSDVSNSDDWIGFGGLADIEDWFGLFKALNRFAAPETDKAFLIAFILAMAFDCEALWDWLG